MIGSLSRWMILMVNSAPNIIHSIKIHDSVSEAWSVFLPFIRQLIIYSIDNRWILYKETINGSLVHTCISIRGNPCKRVFSPSLWLRCPA